MRISDIPIPEPDAEPTVVLRLRLSEAEKFSYGLADVLCWLRGWSAAAGDELRENAPLGVDELRALNIRLKNGIDEVVT